MTYIPEIKKSLPMQRAMSRLEKKQSKPDSINPTMKQKIALKVLELALQDKRTPKSIMKRRSPKMQAQYRESILKQDKETIEKMILNCKIQDAIKRLYVPCPCAQDSLRLALRGKYGLHAIPEYITENTFLNQRFVEYVMGMVPKYLKTI